MTNCIDGYLCNPLGEGDGRPGSSMGLMLLAGDKAEEGRWRACDSGGGGGGWCDHL